MTPGAPQIDAGRLAKVTRLDHGPHPRAATGMCAMEAVAWIVRARFSDRPRCACPVIGEFMRAWNDDLPDDDRTALLLPLIPLIVGTAATPEIEKRRSLMAADWLVRTHTVAWLKLAKLEAAADALATLPEIAAMEQILSIRATIDAAGRDAWAAVSAWGTWGASGAAGVVAARDATAGEAAWRAAACRASAANSGWGFALAAAGDAAETVAWAGNGDALKETRGALQQSAVALVERMCALSGST